MALVQIPVVKSQPLRNQVPVIVGVIPAGAVVRLHKIPRRNHTRKTGYQREVSVTRVNRLVKELRRSEVDLPTAVLLNLRAYKPEDHLIELPEDRLLFCPGEEALYVVDGQHRIEALKRIVEEDPESWSGFEIPFVCMLGATGRQEMEQFYIVNSTAKSVRTDLAFDLLKQRAESDPMVMSALVERGMSWKVTAQTLTEEISKTQLWQGRIRFPGIPKAATTIGSAAMVNSLRLLLTAPYFGSISSENQVKILHAYWQGIRALLPGAFDQPSAYSLQKSVGLQAMHALLVTVLEYVRSVGDSVIEPSSYKKALKTSLLELEGDTSQGEVVRGGDFWFAGPRGAAGSFSSNAGRRVLIAKLKALLPQIEVE